MKYDVNISKTALLDLNEIYAYISFNLESPISAKRIIEKIESKILNLSYMPFRHRLFEYANNNVRIMNVGKYSVFYIVDSKKNLVQVLRIVFGKRKIF